MRMTIVWAAITVIAGACLTIASAVAAQPAIVPVQGYLTNHEGVPIDGKHTLSLALYDSKTGGNRLYQEAHPDVSIVEGAFSLNLGEGVDQVGDPFSLQLFRDENALWLDVVVDTDQQIAPRIVLGAVPYAGYAQSCGPHEHSTADLTNELTGDGVAEATLESRHVAPIVRSTTLAPSNPYWSFACNQEQDEVIPETTIELTVDVPSVLDVSWTGLVANRSSGGATYTRIYVDDNHVGPVYGGYRNGAGSIMNYGQAANVATAKVPAGTHTINVRATCDGDEDGIIVGGTVKVVAWAQP